MNRKDKLNSGCGIFLLYKTVLNCTGCGEVLLMIALKSTKKVSYLMFMLNITKGLKEITETSHEEWIREIDV